MSSLYQVVSVRIDQGILSHEWAEFKTWQDKENAVMQLAEHEFQIPCWIAETLHW
jgi:uncharacterized protein (DUF4415 family)